MTESARAMDAPWRYERLDGAGHWIPLEHPDRLAELALGWLTQPQMTDMQEERP